MPSKSSGKSSGKSRPAPDGDTGSGGEGRDDDAGRRGDPSGEVAHTVALGGEGRAFGDGVAAGGRGAPPVPLVPDQGGGRGLVSVEDERGDDAVVTGELDVRCGLLVVQPAAVQGGGDATRYGPMWRARRRTSARPVARRACPAG